MLEKKRLDMNDLLNRILYLYDLLSGCYKKGERTKKNNKIKYALENNIIHRTYKLDEL
jgi:hypothetical protein